MKFICLKKRSGKSSMERQCFCKLSSCLPCGFSTWPTVFSCKFLNSRSIACGNGLNRLLLVGLPVFEKAMCAHSFFVQNGISYLGARHHSTLSGVGHCSFGSKRGNNAISGRWSCFAWSLYIIIGHPQLLVAESRTRKNSHSVIHCPLNSKLWSSD